MSIYDLRKAQVRFENKIEDFSKSRKTLYKIRSDFVKYFNPEKKNFRKTPTNYEVIVNTELVKNKS